MLTDWLQVAHLAWEQAILGKQANVDSAKVVVP